MGVLDLLRLDGKVALVTGGGRGLGLQIAEGLGEAGATLAITSRKEAGLAEGRRHLEGRGVRCLVLSCDVSQPDEVRSMVDRVVAELGGIDVLVNNAGVTWGAPFEEITPASWDRVVRTNVDGTWYVSHAVGMAMIRQGRGGRIVNIGSVSGLRGHDPRLQQTIAYNASKAAVVNLTRDLAAKLAEHGITVNCICPGFFPTKMTSHTLDAIGERILDVVPLRRFGGSDDLKGLAVLLSSDASAYITGQVIAVDGGMTAI